MYPPTDISRAVSPLYISSEQTSHGPWAGQQAEQYRCLRRAAGDVVVCLRQALSTKGTFVLYEDIDAPNIDQEVSYYHPQTYESQTKVQDYVRGEEPLYIPSLPSQQAPTTQQQPSQYQSAPTTQHHPSPYQSAPQTQHHPSPPSKDKFPYHMRLQSQIIARVTFNQLRRSSCLWATLLPLSPNMTSPQSQPLSRGGLALRMSTGNQHGKLIQSKRGLDIHNRQSASAG